MLAFLVALSYLLSLLNRGVPQGPMLGSLLLLLVIQYADDSSLFKCIFSWFVWRTSPLLLKHPNLNHWTQDGLKSWTLINNELQKQGPQSTRQQSLTGLQCVRGPLSFCYIAGSFVTGTRLPSPPLFAVIASE